MYINRLCAERPLISGFPSWVFTQHYKSSVSFPEPQRDPPILDVGMIVRRDGEVLPTVGDLVEGLDFV